MLLVLIIGLVAGWAVGKVMPGRGLGLIGDLVIGILGAFVGGLLFSMWGLDDYGILGSAIMSAWGAIVVLWIFRILL